MSRCEKERAAGQNLRDLRPSVHLEKEMGALLGASTLLLGALPKNPIDLANHLRHGLFNRAFIAAQHPTLIRHRSRERLGTRDVFFALVDHRAAQPRERAAALAQEISGSVTTPTCRSGTRTSRAMFN